MFIQTPSTTNIKQHCQTQCLRRDRLITPFVSKNDVNQGSGYVDKNDITCTVMPPDQKSNKTEALTYISMNIEQTTPK